MACKLNQNEPGKAIDRKLDAAVIFNGNEAKWRTRRTGLENSFICMARFEGGEINWPRLNFNLRKMDGWLRQECAATYACVCDSVAAAQFSLRGRHCGTCSVFPVKHTNLHKCKSNRLPTVDFQAKTCLTCRTHYTPYHTRSARRQEHPHAHKRAENKRAMLWQIKQTATTRRMSDKQVNAINFASASCPPACLPVQMETETRGRLYTLKKSNTTQSGC